MDIPGLEHVLAQPGPVSSSDSGENNKSTASNVGAHQPTAKEIIKKAIVFIYGQQTDGYNPLGTGFLVKIPSSTRAGKFMVALITARHVVDPKWAHCENKDFKSYALRLNKLPIVGKPQQVGYFNLSYSGSADHTFTTPDDDSIDAAVYVLFFTGELKQYDFGEIPMTWFATDEEIAALKDEDKIFTAGLNPNHVAENENTLPITAGYISSVNDKPLNADCKEEDDNDLDMNDIKALKVWMLALLPRPPRGFSGAPIFAIINRTVGTKSGEGNALVGLQSMNLGNFSGMTPVSGIVSTLKKATATYPEADLRRGFVSPSH